jgi:hypothetical protein
MTLPNPFKETQLKARSGQIDKKLSQSLVKTLGSVIKTDKDIQFLAQELQEGNISQKKYSEETINILRNLPREYEDMAGIKELKSMFKKQTAIREELADLEEKKKAPKATDQAKATGKTALKALVGSTMAGQILLMGKDLFGSKRTKEEKLQTKNRKIDVKMSKALLGVTKQNYGILNTTEKIHESEVRIFKDQQRNSLDSQHFQVLSFNTINTSLKNIEKELTGKKSPTDMYLKKLYSNEKKKERLEKKRRKELQNVKTPELNAKFDKMNENTTKDVEILGRVEKNTEELKMLPGGDKGKKPKVDKDKKKSNKLMWLEGALILAPIILGTLKDFYDKYLKDIVKWFKEVLGPILEKIGDFLGVSKKGNVGIGTFTKDLTSFLSGKGFTTLEKAKKEGNEAQNDLRQTTDIAIARAQKRVTEGKINKATGKKWTQVEVDKDIEKLENMYQKAAKEGKFTPQAAVNKNVIPMKNTGNSKTLVDKDIKNNKDKAAEIKKTTEALNKINNSITNNETSTTKVGGVNTNKEPKQSYSPVSDALKYILMTGK